MPTENASLTPIYDRLHAANGYHPLSADTFADWTVEAGDIVTVQRGNESYASPVSSMHLVWRGTPEVTINATGNEKRDSIARVSRRKYGRGGAGMQNTQALYYEVFSEDGELHSAITMTASNIRTEVHATNSQIYSYIDQTATYIIEQIGGRTGSKIVAGMTEPQEDPDEPFVDGDTWIQTTFIGSWDDAENIDWTDEETWQQINSAKVFTRVGSEWKEALDETILTEYTEFERTREKTDQTAVRVEYVNGELQRNVGNLTVRADQIDMRVTQNANSIGELGSHITQTAREIRAEVHAGSSQLYSYIEQTATYIRSEVVSVESQLRSSITQTASQIRAEVQSGVSQLQSSITQNANKIALVVEGTGSNISIKPASIVAAINNGASSVIISADHINLSGYVRASDLTTNWLKTNIANIDVVNVKALTVTYAMGPSSSETVGFGSLVKDLQIVQDGNNYKLQKKIASSGTWTDVGTFSRATSLSGEWSSNRYTVTASPQGNRDIVVPYVQVIGSNGGRYASVYVATGKDTAPFYDLHGDATRLYMVASGNKIYLKDQDSTSAGSTYAEIESGNPYTHSMSITRVIAGRSSSGTDTYFGKLYYWDDDVQEYEPAYTSNAYWYRSSTNKSGTTTVHY